MARSSFTIQYTCSFEEAQQKVETILKEKGFQLQTIKTGEYAWKCGVGALTAMKFIKVEYAPNQIELSAWIQTGFAGFGGEELALTGFSGALPKRQLMNIIEEIKRMF